MDRRTFGKSLLASTALAAASPAAWSQGSDPIIFGMTFDAAKQAVSFTSGKSRADLDSDLQLTLAVTRLVEIIGEAAKRVSPEVRERLSRWRLLQSRECTGIKLTRPNPKREHKTNPQQLVIPEA